MKTAKLVFSSEEEIRKYVEEGESAYLAEVMEACDLAFDGGNIITLSGPTCSGKTTTARILDDEFLRRGKTLHTISIDDFYLERDLLEERSRITGAPVDYDSPSTIDIELFARVIDEIERKGRVSLPRFDFKTGSRTGFYEIECTDGDVFLFEGIQAVYPELTRYLETHSYTPLFISVEKRISYGDVVFDRKDLRLLRRIVRDSWSRNTSAEKTFELWDGVCANETRHIYPNLNARHKRIDSSMPYEVSVIKPFALPLLYGIKKDSAHFEKANELIKQLESVPVIDAKYVPHESVFREFIGE